MIDTTSVRGELSDVELRIIDLYRRMDDEMQFNLHLMVQALADQFPRETAPPATAAGEYLQH